MSNALQAGVGRSIITPPLGVRLVGFAGRPTGCTSVRDELTATAVVLLMGSDSLAIVGCDLLKLHHTLVAQVRQRVQDDFSIPGERVMICCSHTHSGPPGYAAPGTPALDKRYVACLPDLIAGTIGKAVGTLAPARLAAGIGRTEIAINRRETLADGTVILGEYPDGPIDRDVGVLRIDATDGTPLATVVNATCHPVILGPKSLAVSADFVGRARSLVEQATGAPMLFLQGACGDINPRGGVQADDRNCIRLGGALAGDILSAWAMIETTDDSPRLEATSCMLPVPLAADDAAERPERLSSFFDRIDIEFPWAADVIEDCTPMEVQAFRIGELGIVAVGCEPFVETGLAAKSGSPATTTFFAGYSDGNIGYVPTAAALEAGGYEAEVAHRYYRLPAPVAQTAERLVAATATESLTAVFDLP